MSTSLLSVLTPDQLAALSPDQLAALSPAAEVPEPDAVTKKVLADAPKPRTQTTQEKRAARAAERAAAKSAGKLVEIGDMRPARVKIDADTAVVILAQSAKPNGDGKYTTFTGGARVVPEVKGRLESRMSARVLLSILTDADLAERFTSAVDAVEKRAHIGAYYVKPDAVEGDTTSAVDAEEF